MPESFDLQSYVDHLRARWRLLVVACLVAGVLAGGISLLLPKQYTATAKIVIEPPAGSDPRSAMAVSPIYLESLRTYEHFAASNKLFSQAVDHFGLRERAPGRSLEAWKSRVLKVTIPRNTKILEVSATFENPQQAHALALYIAEETIKLNRAITREGDRELTDDAAEQLEAARRARDEAEAQWSRYLSAEPVESLSAEIDTLDMRQLRVERELLDADARVAELAANELKDVREQLAPMRARADHLRNQIKEIEQGLAQKRALLAKRAARREELETRRRTTQAAYEATLARVRDTQAAVGYRGERLKLIDPGVVPEKPSSPRIVLNVGAAVLFALVLSLFYVSLLFAYGGGRRSAAPLPLRRARTGHD